MLQGRATGVSRPLRRSLDRSPTLREPSASARRHGDAATRPRSGTVPSRRRRRRRRVVRSDPGPAPIGVRPGSQRCNHRAGGGGSIGRPSLAPATARRGGHSSTDQDGDESHAPLTPCSRCTTGMAPLHSPSEIRASKPEQCIVPAPPTVRNQAVTSLLMQGW